MVGSIVNARRPDTRAIWRRLAERGTAERVALGCGAVVIPSSLVVVVGWLSGTEGLAALVPGYVPMKFNTALCFLAAGMALTRLISSRISLALVLFVTVLGALTLLEYVLGVGLGIDEVVVRDPDPAQLRNPPGRMAVVTAVAFTTFGTGWLLVRHGRPRIGQILFLVPALVGATTLLGYLYRAESLYELVAATTVSMPTGFGLVLIAVGAAARVPAGAVSWVLEDSGAGGVLVRRLLPVGLILLPVLGFLCLQGQTRGYYGTRYGLVLMVTGAAIATTVAAVSAARRAATLDRARSRAQQDLEELNASLVQGRDQAWTRAESLARELADERARFARATARLDDVVWSVELMPDHTQRLAFASGSATGVFGGEMPVGNDMASTMAALVHPEDLGLHQDFNGKVARGEPAETELRLVGLDQLTRWVWVRGTPRREGDRLFYDGITTNITERHEIAERLAELVDLQEEQVAALASLHRARDQFFAAAGHELRNPMTVISGYTSLLSDDESLTPQQHAWAATITRRVSTMSALLDELFDLSKINAGASELAMVEVAVDTLVAQCVEDHRAEADQRGLVLRTDLAPATATIDPDRVTQIVDNLLSNALKYTPESGVVTTRCLATPKGVTVTVHDTGIGIPHDELTELFEPFYRASTATDAKIEGSGLGLHISKTLALAHSGDLIAQSTTAAGTTLTLTLPTQQPAPPGPEVPTHVV